MAISKVTLNGETLMDVTSDTVEANNLLSGNTATKNDGTKVTGTASSGTDTSQANATAGTIRVNSSAYVNGELIQGLYEPNLWEGRVSSSPLSRTVYPLEAVTDYTPEEIISVSDTMTLSGSRFVYNLGQWTTSMEEYWTYNIRVSMEIGEQYYECQSIFEYSVDAMPIKCDLVHYGENIVHLYAYITDTQIYIEADDPTATVSFNLYIGTPEIDGLYAVTVDPYTLVEKTVTPSTQTQVIRSSTTTSDILKIDADPISTMSGATYTIGSTFLRVNYATSIGLTAGQTYRFNARFRRQSDGVTYVFNALVKINNVFTSVALDLYDPTHTTSFKLMVKSMQAELTCSDSTANKTASGFYLEISNETIEADALGQVTVNPIPSEYVIPTGTLAISQNGTVDVKNYEYANVNVEGGGGTTADESLPVRFLDYDGTVVYSYTAEDFANLSTMPSNPSHTGLTAQGWNWSLADAKEYVAEYGMLEIGQMYITDDGKTRIYVTLDEYTLELYLGVAVNGTIEIDWGDDSAVDTATGSSLSTLVKTQHIYSSIGNYVINITSVSGAYKINGATSDCSYLLALATGNDDVSRRINRKSASTITKIELGNSVSVGGYGAFSYCINLKTITIPNNNVIDSSTNSYTFGKCYSLSAIIFPADTVAINSYFIESVYSLKRISISKNMTISSYSIRTSESLLERATLNDTAKSLNNDFMASRLEYITIPPGVTSISISTNKMRSVDLSRMTSPTGTIQIRGAKIEEILLPNGMTSISASAFYQDMSLKSITIPSEVTSIQSGSFNECHSLRSITIPSGVTSIGTNAFRYCANLRECHVLPTTPPTLDSNVFQNTHPNLKIYVPAESLEAYKTAVNWGTYADYMVGE